VRRLSPGPGLKGRLGLGLLVVLEINQRRLQQALARHPVAGLISRVEDTHVAAAQLGRTRASTNCRQACRLARAKGTSYLAAPCAPISPRRTRSWMASGSSWTSASRRLTQLTE